MSYDNTNRGSIWPNERKETETHPDFTGTSTIECPHCNEASDFWTNGWKRKKGANPKAPSLSMTFRAKDAKQPSTDAPLVVAGFEEDEWLTSKSPF